MGLDMYLYRREFVSGTAFNENDPALFNSVTDALGIESSIAAPHMIVDVCVAYWRKANAIHAWIVDNCAGGTDNCQPISVSVTTLRELKSRVASVLLSTGIGDEPLREAAEREGLMPRAGFFFGSTALDDNYIYDMKSTMEQLTKVLASVENEWTDFVYQASW